MVMRRPRKSPIPPGMSPMFVTMNTETSTKSITALSLTRNILMCNFVLEAAASRRPGPPGRWPVKGGLLTVAAGGMAAAGTELRVSLAQAPSGLEPRPSGGPVRAACSGGIGSLIEFARKR